MKTSRRLDAILERVVVDRTPGESLRGVGAAWVACTLALPLYLLDVQQVSHVFIGSLVILPLVVVGFAAASRCRPLPPGPEGGSRIRLGTFALALGGVLGLLNLAANFGLASMDPVLRALLVDRFSTLPLEASVIGAPILEETAMRLVFMGVVGWGLTFVVSEARWVFLGALGISAVAFGLIHIFRPMPEQSSLAVLYGVGVVFKSGAASLLLGWVFWRWGLPYAIISHSLANGTHRLLAPLLFS